MRREDKAQYIEDLRSVLTSSQLVIRTRFTGLDIARMTQLRRDIRAAGGGYKVVKNTLLRRAAEGTGAEALLEDLKGPVALAYTANDPVVVAKAIADFAKDEEVFSFEGGVLSGKAMTAAQVENLASLPGKDELRAQFLAMLQAVPQKLLRVLNAPARDMVGVLDARRRSIEEQA